MDDTLSSTLVSNYSENDGSERSIISSSERSGGEVRRKVARLFILNYNVSDVTE